MRIQLQTEGGFAPIAGLAQPFTLDSAQLPPDEADELQRLVHEARFFELSSSPAPARGADYRTYTITAQDGSQTHTIRCSDPVADHSLQNLIDFVQKHKVFHA